MSLYDLHSPMRCCITIYLMPATRSFLTYPGCISHEINIQTICLVRVLRMNWGVFQSESRICSTVWWYSTTLKFTLFHYCNIPVTDHTKSCCFKCNTVNCKVITDCSRLIPGLEQKVQWSAISLNIYLHMNHSNLLAKGKVLVWEGLRFQLVVYSVNTIQITAHFEF